MATIPGVDTAITDEPISAGEANATDTLFLLSSDTAAPVTPTRVTRADTTSSALNTQLRAYFDAGGDNVILQGHTGTNRPSLTDAIALLPKGHPGQIVAPEVITSADIITVADEAWKANKVFLANGPVDCTDTQAETIAAAVIASGTDSKGKRGAGFWPDTALIAPLSGSTLDKVPYSVIVAGLIARSERENQGDPGLAAAGVKRGYAPNVQGVSVPRTSVQRTLLSAQGKQINVAHVDTGNNTLSYGFRTLANLAMLPQWWDFSGSRVIMKIRAQAAAVDESFLFDRIDGEGRALARYETALRSFLFELHRVGALFGATPAEAYSVDVSPRLNPVTSLQRGELTAAIRVKVSPFVEHITTNITRRALAATL